MPAVSKRVDTSPAVLWVAVVASLTAALVAGSVLARELVYDRFIWQYFWGPVAADGNGATCAARGGGTGVEYLSGITACTTAEAEGLIVAYPGYTWVSTIGYIVVLLLALIGVLLLLQRLDIGEDHGFFFALVPFMLFGGALRTIEDAGVAALGVDGAEPLIAFPSSALIISPFIYVTMFVITLITVIASVWLERSGVVKRYEYPLAATGTALVAGSFGYLFYLGATAEYATIYPQVLILTLALATLATVLTWWGIERFKPTINAGTGHIGLVVIWAHAVDGVANVIGLNWMPALGAGNNLLPKHRINEGVVVLTNWLLPDSVVDVIGDAWPFLFLKLAAATVIILIFEPELFEESPKYTMLLLIAVAAVGLGPGTRDMLRATFGI